MFVNGVPLIVTVSRNIPNGTVYGLPSIKISGLEIAIKNNITPYVIRGFGVQFVLIDLQFQAIKDWNKIDSINNNIVSSYEHMEDI